MGRMLSAGVIAVCFAVGLSGQEQAVKERTKVKTDDAKIVTWTGCLRASDDGFDLTEVRRGTSGNGSKESRTPNMVMLRQVPATVDLQKYVGHRVAVTGAAEKDVFEDIQVKIETEKRSSRRVNLP